MKILIVINDNRDMYNEYQHTGVLRAPKRRSVEIELTPQQIEKIDLQRAKHGEEIESVSIVKER